MAQRVNIELVDDIDGKAADSTVTFGLDGVTYEIDLSDKNAAKLRDQLATYIAAGRRVGKTPGVKAKGAAKTGPNPKEVRAWAKDNGFPDVPDRGRIPADVMEAFNSAS